jgi:hypothetical protein
MLYGIKHQNHKNLWLYTAVVLLMMGENSIRNMWSLKFFKKEIKHIVDTFNWN